MEAVAAKILLRSERWQEGFRTRARMGALGGYRERLDVPDDLPLRDGAPLGGRRLLVLQAPADGLGDHIQFVRYVPLVAGGTVILRATGALRRLYRINFPGVELLRPGADAGADLWAPAASLPALLGADGPPPATPYLRADPADVVRWRDRLPDDGRPRIGLVWEIGEPIPGSLFTPVSRGIDLANLAPLAEVPGVRWVSLQVGDNEDDPAPPGLALVRPDPNRDMADTAAIVSLLDLTIGIDTSVTNLAGALGAPAWVVLPSVPDYRWGSRAASPWYSSAKLFKQERPGDWAPVVARVADELARLVAQRGAGQ